MQKETITLLNSHERLDISFDCQAVYACYYKHENKNKKQKTDNILLHSKQKRQKTKYQVD